MNDRQRQAEFVRLVTDAQRRLYAYILTLLPRPAEADDVLQETNLVLWEKSETFEMGSDFNAWAATIAYYQTLAYLKRRTRQNWLGFDSSLVSQLAQTAAQQVSHYDERRTALVHCLDKLALADRDLVARRYQQDASVDRVAEQVGRSSGAIKQALYRIRGALLKCIERTLTGDAT
ncbi:MAG: sigma-70 family RNA polymerase sigma factor [Planctomycetes bacterium]|nr:sigma-70 family RNA polymerase sigma factor [Planctomycetota bacterium]